VEGDLLDYIGGELFARAESDDEAALLVDFARPIPRRGALIGVGGFFIAPTGLTVSVMRPVGDRYLVIWQSPLIEIEDAGEQRERFSNPVGVEEKDVIGYDFSTSVKVSFDSGTGNKLYLQRSLPLGAMIDPSSFKWEKDKRSYPLGAFAILE
jgi:hypothetical protein